jgi:hypothetical protein
MQLSINAWALGAVALFFAYKAFRHFYWDKPEMITSEGLPVPMSVGKQRSFHSLTRDASMYTEARRRRAIQGGTICNDTVNFQKTGFTNGVVEAYFLTGICEGACAPRNVVEDGGTAQTEVCAIIDGNGGDVLDFGNAATTICDI